MGNCFGSDEPAQGALLGATIDSTIPSTVTVGKVKGKGGFSDVYAVQVTGKPGQYALKVMLVPTPERLDMAKNECKYLAQLQSPHIIKLHASKIEGEKVFMLLDYYDRGTLGDVITYHQKAGTRLGEKEALTMFRNICTGVKVLHSNNPPLVHRDLKPGNVLLSSENAPVLMDFGSIGEAHLTFNTHKDASRVQDFCAEACSILYRAPELFNVTVDSKLDERVDIWSLGCVLYCMLFYTSPFESAYYDGSVALAAMNAKVTIPASSKYSSDVHQLILSLLQAEPSGRPYIDAVIETTEKLISRAT